MKKLLLILSIFFAVLTIAGAIYVLVSDGVANAGYAVVPMLFCLSCSNGYRALKAKENSNKHKE